MCPEVLKNAKLKMHNCISSSNICVCVMQKSVQNQGLRKGSPSHFSLKAIHKHGDAQFRGMCGDEAVNLVCIASRSEHSTFITYLTVVQ